MSSFEKSPPSADSVGKEPLPVPAFHPGALAILLRGHKEGAFEPWALKQIKSHTGTKVVGPTPTPPIHLSWLITGSCFSKRRNTHIFLPGPFVTHSCRVWLVHPCVCTSLWDKGYRMNHPAPDTQVSTSVSIIYLSIGFFPNTVFFKSLNLLSPT